MMAVIYARYSNGPDQTEQSIEGQIRECTEFAHANNITIIASYTDSAKSGRTDNRDAFQRMLRDSEKGLFDTVLVWKMDRFARNRYDSATYKAKLKKNGVRVIYVKEHIPEGPEGIILESVLEGMAEYYTANLSQNIMRGMRESAMKGRCTGAVVIGYDLDGDKKYKVNPVEAETVRMIFDMFDHGASYAQMTEELNAQHRRTKRGKPFNANSFHTILRNRKYIGEYQWHDILIPNAIPAIIDKDLFDRVQKRLEVRKHTSVRKTVYNSDDAPEFLLTTKIFCGCCGTNMIGDSGTSKGGYRYYYYTCTRRKHGKDCKKKSISKDLIENKIIQQTVDIILQDDVIDEIADRVMEIQQKQAADDSEVTYYTHRLGEVKTSINNIIKAIEQGIITASTKDRLQELENEKIDIAAALEKAKIKAPQLGKEQVVYFLKKLRCGSIDDIKYRRNIISTFINAVYVFDDDDGGHRLSVVYNIIRNDTPISLEQVLSVRSENRSLHQKRDPNKIVRVSFYSLKKPIFYHRTFMQNTKLQTGIIYFATCISSAICCSQWCSI